MPDHVSAPALTPSAPLGDAPGVDPTALPPVTGNGPQSPSTADAFGATGSAPNVMDEPRESVGAASASGEALADRAAEDLFGSEDNARNTAGRITSFVASWERHEHEKPPAVWLSGEFGKGRDSSPGVEDSATLRGSRIFPCIACGACCRNLIHSPLYTDLDRGDGICRHFDVSTNLCRIYEIRPRICRVSEMFEAFEDRLAWEEYVDLNLQSCHELRSRAHTPEPGTDWKE